MKRQRGFSIIAVVFILVVLAGLGAVIVQLGATQHLGTLMAQEGRQAWYAARAGLEWGRHRAINAGSCAASTTHTDLFGFRVEVQCAAQVMTEGARQLTVYQLTSVATANVGALDEARREARMSVWEDTTP